MTASLPFDGQPDRPAGAAAPVAQLVERLGARLGDDAIQGVALADTHRPQYAWQVAEPVGDRTRRPAAPAPSDEYQPQWRSGPGRADRLLLKRPLWMLPEPVRLEARDEAPLHEGPLTLLRGPERIETGWWDEHGIARDYFVAANPKGVHLWIYRDRSAKGGWFLHGMFG
jgi:protein ImuB